MRRSINIVLLLLIFIVSFVYRFSGILDNHPFWVDEFSSANQARLILEQGLDIFTNSALHIEKHNFVTHAIIALFFKIFGQSEWSARLPFVIFGSLVPVLVFILTKKIYNTSTAISASLLTLFSYFLIAWSKQARGYTLLQVIILSVSYLYILIKEDVESKNKNDGLYLKILSICFLIIIGYFTHALFLVFLSALFLDVLIFNQNLLRKLLRNAYFYIFTIVLFGFSIIFGQFQDIVASLGSFGAGISKINNLWYYHSYLWRSYAIVTFLAILGFLINFFTNRKHTSLFLIYVILHLIFLNFFFSAYVTRYLLPIFPLIIINAAYTLNYLTSKFLKEQKIRSRLLHFLVPVGLVLFIILNGDKFVRKPLKFYSVNNDFREIALIDYNMFYKIIKEKGRVNEGKTAVVDTWTDRTYWYLGRDFKNAYIFRWIDEPGTVNGLLKKTYFTYNRMGEKIIPENEDLRFIGELFDLKRAMARYPRGFIFIDDSSMPKDVITFAERNFKKELYLDHYPLDDNPYSIWPATLYSWGIK